MIRLGWDHQIWALGLSCQTCQGISTTTQDADTRSSIAEHYSSLSASTTLISISCVINPIMHKGANVKATHFFSLEPDAYPKQRKWTPLTSVRLDNFPFTLSLQDTFMVLGRSRNVGGQARFYEEFAQVYDPVRERLVDSNIKNVPEARVVHAQLLRGVPSQCDRSSGGREPSPPEPSSMRNAFESGNFSAMMLSNTTCTTALAFQSASWR